VKHQAFAIAAFLAEETGELVHPAQRRLIETAGDFARSNGGHFKLGQSGDPRLHLLRPVLEYSIHDRHAGRGIAQGVPFGDEGDELELVQLGSFSVN
jgi:hypothetical protein